MICTGKLTGKLPV